MSAGLKEGLMEEQASFASLEVSQAEEGPAEAIILRILAGEQEAFEELMSLTERKVLAVAWRLLGNRDQARDAAQDVFLRIYRSLNTFRQGENFQAWVYRITVNVCCDHARKRGPLMLSTDFLETVEDAPRGKEASVEAVLVEQRRTLVRRALETLTPAERSALVLRDLEGLSTHEVAETLGVRPVTIRSQISSARAKVQVFCARVIHRSSGGLP